MRLTIPCLFALALGSGCALTSKSDPIEFRYYSAEPQPVSAPAATGSLDLRRVRAASHLTQKILFRVSEREYGYYETQRWTDDPAEYLRRGLERALFEGQGLERASREPDLVLEVELTGFEEVRADDGTAASSRVVASFVLYKAGRSVAVETVEISKPIADSDATSSVATACADGLSEVIQQISARVAQALEVR